MKSIFQLISTLFIPTLSVVFCAGCVKDKSDVSATPGTLTIGYQVDGMQAGTYSTPAEGHELAVNDVHILFYEMGENSEGGGNLTGGYVTYQHATLTHGTSTFSFPLPDALVPKTDYRTIIIGNAHSFVPAEYSSFDAYLNVCKSMTYDEAKQKIYAELTGNTMSCLPMWGKLVDGTGAEIPFRFESKTSATITGTIHLSRSVCRLDLKNYAANNLQIAWVKVCNYRSKGYYFHNDVPYGDIRPGLSSAPPSGIGDGYVRVSEPANGVQELKAGLYAFANAIPVVAQNDDLTTYLMIAGYYQDGSETPNTSKLTYYRFNMAELGSSQLLKRNYIYRASIMSVKGAGADSEQGAKDETSPLLEYQVDDEWDDDDDDTATDDYGNFLILSRTQVTFSDGLKNLTEVVKVKVKAGMSWEVVADHSPTDRADAFGFEKVSASSFGITTLLDNASPLAFNGRLKVIATTAQNTKLELSVFLTQFSSSDEMQILLVDGRNGTISKRVPGSGGTLSLLVQTGSNYAGWTAEDDGNSFTAWNGASFTRAGADKGYMTIVVPANTSSAERTATLLVHREGVPDVTIVLTQPKSNYLLTISPMPTDGTLTFQGFSSSLSNPNGISAQKEFWVTLADPANYTFTVTSSFDKNRDLRLSMTNALSPATQTTQTANIVTDVLPNGVNGGKFWLNVFRTGPGDPTMRGTITVKAVPKTAGLAEHEVSFNVNIVTSCSIGDAILDLTDLASNLRILVADRNMGSKVRIDEYGNFVPALNFSNVANLKITGYTNPDSQNMDFKGEYRSFSTNAQAYCPTLYADKNVDNAETFSPYYKSADRNKWTTPSQQHLTGISRRMVFSKQRPFVVSTVRDSNNKFIGCFFPIAGNAGAGSTEGGYYFSLTSSAENVAYAMRVYPSSAGELNNVLKTEGCSLRCIRIL